MDKRFRARRTIGTIYKGVGVICGMPRVAFIGLVIAGAVSAGGSCQACGVADHFGRFGRTA